MINAEKEQERKGVCRMDQNYNYNYNNNYQTQYTGQPQKKEKKAGNGFGARLAKWVAIALVFGLVAGTAFAGTSYFWGNLLGKDTKITATAGSSDSGMVKTTGTSSAQTFTAVDVSDITEEVMPSIVAITNLSVVEYSSWFGGSRSYEVPSCGSGIIVSQDDEHIYIATNNHVVSDANTLTVQFMDDSTADAAVEGVDEGNDLAVVSVATKDLSAETMNQIKVATLGNSSELKVGQTAIAIGNALGYGQSVTTGVISALDRELTVSDESTGTQSVVQHLIQTDAAINPGNSGGALLNTRGEVIGINSIKYTDTDVEGMGYAIPIDVASPILERLMNRQSVDESEAAYLGISGVDVSSSDAQLYRMPRGIYIYRLDDGEAADTAGLLPGDIITSFNGTSMKTMAELESAMQYCKAGDSVDVVFYRQTDGEYKEQTVTVTLGNRK